MILTCPACDTQYVVKDGAIPAGGRKVRCASCRHSWHQDPPPEETLELSEESEVPVQPESPPHPEQVEWEEAETETEADASGYDLPEADEDPGEPDSGADHADAPAAEEPERALVVAPAEDDDFSPFAQRGAVEERRRSPWLKILLAILLAAALAAAFWFLAPQEWKARLGLGAAAETPLQLMMTHSDRQRLESGNELLAVSGRVINPTGRSQTVPPITAELRSKSGELVYRWTIAPPARTLEPGASATFNSAEVNVPAGGEDLTVSLGAPAA